MIYRKLVTCSTCELESERPKTMHTHRTLTYAWCTRYPCTLQTMHILHLQIGSLELDFFTIQTAMHDLGRMDR